jgi:hypothetical protein
MTPLTLKLVPFYGVPRILHLVWTEGDEIRAGKDPRDHNPEETQQPTGRGGKVSQLGDPWLAELLSPWKQYKEVPGFRSVCEDAIEAVGQDSQRGKRELE